VNSGVRRREQRRLWRREGENVPRGSMRKAGLVGDGDVEVEEVVVVAGLGLLVERVEVERRCEASVE